MKDINFAPSNTPSEELFSKHDEKVVTTKAVKAGQDAKSTTMEI